MTDEEWQKTAALMWPYGRDRCSCSAMPLHEVTAEDIFRPASTFCPVHDEAEARRFVEAERRECACR